MIEPSETRIAFFGGAASETAVAAVTRLYNAGYDVVVADHDPRESVALHDAGVPLASSRAEALEGARVVLTSCADSSDVEELYLGENGLLELMSPGMCAIDLSFSSPNLAREIHAVAAISDIEVMDAPLVNLGEKERSCIFVGGTPELQRQYAPLFPYIAESIFAQDEAGEGQLAAMIAYIALAGSIMGAVEAYSVARVSGLSANKALAVLAETSGGSRALVEYLPRAIGHDYAGHLKVSTFLEALSVALESAEELDITVPMLETAYQLYELLSVVGGDELNIQALALLYEDEETCAEYGLDWALAERLGPGDDFDDDDDEGVFGGGLFSGGGPGSGPGAGPGGGMPPLGGFYSRN